MADQKGTVVAVVSALWGAAVGSATTLVATERAVAEQRRLVEEQSVEEAYAELVTTATEIAVTLWLTDQAAVRAAGDAASDAGAEALKGMDTFIAKLSELHVAEARIAMIDDDPVRLAAMDRVLAEAMTGDGCLSDRATRVRVATGLLTEILQREDRRWEREVETRQRVLEFLRDVPIEGSQRSGSAGGEQESMESEA